jgi:hypothetical protein
MLLKRPIFRPSQAIVESPAPPARPQRPDVEYTDNRFLDGLKPARGGYELDRRQTPAGVDPFWREDSEPNGPGFITAAPWLYRRP